MKPSDASGTQILAEEDTGTPEKNDPADDEDGADEKSQLLKRDQKSSDRETLTVSFPPPDNSCI